MNSLRFCILLLSIFSQTRVVAQAVPPLERLITVDIRNAPLENALREISRAGRFEFSYNPARIDGKAVVTVRLTNAPVREVLNRVFQPPVSYKSKGNYVILVRTDPPDSSPKNFLLDGYILDEQTGERIAQASIFEKTTLASTVSNPFGYYRLRLPTDLSAVRLDVRKAAYVGETVLIRSRVSHSVSIRMTPVPARLSLEMLPIRVTEDTTRSVNTLAAVSVDLLTPGLDSTTQPQPKSILEKGYNGITRFFVSAQQSIHDINLSRDTLYRDWQVSFLPFIGTNHRLSGRISNRISVNALIGYSFGVRAFEVGGLLNLVRSDVSGFQAGGLGNIVGGNVSGVQAGGLFNFNGGTAQGVQAGGLFNFNGGKVSGVQAGGLFNVNGGTVEGVQAGGLFNVNVKQAQGVQLGGLFNVTAGELTNTVQVGGLFNVAGKSVRGLQLAGLANVAAGDVQGWQVSGIVNRARSVRGGHQIGFINLADSSGNVPIGLFSHVQKGGFRRFEVAATEINLLNLTYRTGVRRFYNIISAGSDFGREGSADLTAGYGLGTGFVLSKSTLFTLEGTHHHHFYFNQSDNGGWNNQIRLSTLFETKLGNRLFLAYGPSVNWFFSSDNTTPPTRRPNVLFFSSGTDEFSTSRHWGWVGLQIGLRFGNS